MEKHIIEFSQDGCIPAVEGKSLLEASLEAGIPMMHVCGGKGQCSTCRVLIHSGQEVLSKENEREKILKNQLHFPPNVRLACQTLILGGPIKVTRIVRDVTDFSLYIGEGNKEIGEEKELALFFMDIRNFSPFMEKNLPFDVIHIIRKLFTFCEDIINKSGGRLVETAGDSLYAIFGYSTNLIKGLNAATSTAIEIINDLKTLNKEYFQPHFNHKIDIGIGIHTGKVIMGKVKLGSNERLLAMGHAVNVASRIQSLTKELNNNLIISQEVFIHLDHKPQNATPLDVNLKGLSGKFKVYLLGVPYD